MFSAISQNYVKERYFSEMILTSHASPVSSSQEITVQHYTTFRYGLRNIFAANINNFPVLKKLQLFHYATLSGYAARCSLMVEKSGWNDFMREVTKSWISVCIEYYIRHYLMAHRRADHVTDI